MDRSSNSVLVIGGGTWGLAIAYRLAKRGYSDIKVLDGQTFPSAIAAGNDLNKIMEEQDPPSATDDDISYAWSTIETLATEVWKTDPVYKTHYHPTGFIYAAVGNDAYAKVAESVEAHSENWQSLRTAEGFQATMPEGVLTGEFPAWRGFLRDRKAGWVAAREVMGDLYEECRRLGVEFIAGENGKVMELLYDASRSDVVGARTADGVEHLAERTILAAGANSDLLLDFKKQLRPTAWTLAHLPLTAEEAKTYRNLPVLYGVDRGFFIEPDNDGHEIKLCDEHPGYINLVKNAKTGLEHSVPFAKEQIPIEAEQRMRHLLRETMPQLADRAFTYARICWDADTPDRLFLIGEHPDYKSLIVAVGGSGHGFMCSPAVGLLVADVLEGKMNERLGRILGWRPESAVERDWWDTQGRYGAEGKVMGFADVEGWTKIGRWDQGRL